MPCPSLLLCVKRNWLELKDSRPSVLPTSPDCLRANALLAGIDFCVRFATGILTPLYFLCRCFFGSSLSRRKFCHLAENINGFCCGCLGRLVFPSRTVLKNFIIARSYLHIFLGFNGIDDNAHYVKRLTYWTLYCTFFSRSSAYFLPCLSSWDAGRG